MNILLLGNGYDLNYKLPTSYHSFLLTADFLKKRNLELICAVGDVFGSPDLSSQDASIKKSYDAYKEIFDSVVLDKDSIRRMVDLAESNIWFSYFLKSFNREAGWIDFEREVAYVIDCFQSFFREADIVFVPNKVCKKTGSKHVILNAFNFFLEETGKSRNLVPTGSRKVANEYTYEYPLGSGEYLINEEKIIAFLHEELNKFVEMLRIYLQCFVEKSAKVLINDLRITQLQALAYTDVVVTLNYTSTYETINSDAQVFHIHGSTDNKIVLGINPDNSDKIESIDTAFVEFKKYYQRTFYGTDIPYLRWIRDQRYGGRNEDIHLLIMGHSLDVTDREVIEDLFGLASKITILYHNESAKSQYIRNLVNIFGKERFDQIRDEQQLELLPLDMDFSELSEKRAGNSTIQYEARLESFL